MLKVRIIPVLLWKEFGLVKGIGFNSSRRVGSALPAMKIYNQREVDELFFVDIYLNETKGSPDYELIKELSSECFVPLTVGGGITNENDVYALLRTGADKISINTAAFANPNLISNVAKQFGSQSIVSSIDARAVNYNKWVCFSHSGSYDTGRNVIDWAREVEDRGAGEILLTSIDMDGTMAGYDLALIEAVTSAVHIPVIASGGAGSYQDMVDAVKESGASAVAAASIFHFTELTPAGAKEALSHAGFEVRRPFL
jgi:cyclase